ncbi:MAG: hemolysin III family protein [Cellulomonas sp.]|jgi:hemolysin III|nr:hemolysin III family protein [Cellulomonas sp.]
MTAADAGSVQPDDGLSRAVGTVGGAVEAAGDRVGQVAATLGPKLKPKLRGWIHAGVAPFVLAAGIVIIALSPTAASRWANVVFTIAGVLLFGISAVYHRGTWSPRVAGVLRRLDHTNIFLVIAGTYTPLSVILLEARTARVLLIVVWSGALVGLLMRVFWLGAPRWLYVPIYLALGWVAVALLPQFAESGGTAVLWLVVSGGLAYSLGAVVYGLKRPDPSPRWFGFHEIFHVLTVAGYTCLYIAVFIATYNLR